MSMNWNKWVRQTHRWLSMAFTVAVIVNIVAVVQGRYTSRVGLLAVFPLALLLLTGLYLFVLPYVTKRGAAPTERAGGLTPTLGSCLKSCVAHSSAHGGNTKCIEE